MSDSSKKKVAHGGRSHENEGARYELYEDGRMLEWYFEGSDVYIHTPGVRRILCEAGFEVAELYGGHSGEPFTGGSPMMVIIARPIA